MVSAVQSKENEKKDMPARTDAEKKATKMSHYAFLFKKIT